MADNLGHAGSWFGLPDFGITELLSKTSGTGRTGQGGSDLIPNLPSFQNNYQYNPTMNAASNPNLTPSQYQSSVYGYNAPSSSNYGGNVSSAPTIQQQQSGGNSSGGNSGGIDWSSPTNWGFDVPGAGHFQTPQDYQNWLNQQNQQNQRKWNDQWGMYDDQVAEAQRYQDEIYGLLGNQEGANKQNYEAALSTIGADYNANEAALKQGKEKNAAYIAQNERAAQTRKEDALASARRMYDELRRANTQRFGGSTSAGQAASELQAREQQSQQGQTNRQFNEFMQQASSQKADLENQYNTGLLQLQQQKQSAIQQATSDFQKLMQDLTNSKVQTAQQKGQARINALTALRDQIFQINQQEDQFKKTLEMQKTQAQQQIDSYWATTGKTLANQQQAFSSYTGGVNLTPNSQYKIGDNYFTASAAPQYIGAIGKRIVGTDEMGRNVYDDGTAGWTKYDAQGNAAK